MEYLSVVAAGLAGYAFGAVWYGALGARWRIETGLSEEDVRPAANLGAYAIAFVSNVLIAGMARHIFAASEISGVAAGALSGLGLGLFIGGSFLAVNYAFARRSKALALIDIGHAAGVGATIGAVLGALM